jgi:hypothetical protein
MLVYCGPSRSLTVLEALASAFSPFSPWQAPHWNPGGIPCPKGTRAVPRIWSSEDFWGSQTCKIHRWPSQYGDFPVGIPSGSQTGYGKCTFDYVYIYIVWWCFPCINFIYRVDAANSRWLLFPIIDSFPYINFIGFSQSSPSIDEILLDSPNEKCFFTPIKLHIWYSWVSPSSPIIDAFSLCTIWLFSIMQHSYRKVSIYSRFTT